MHGSTFVRRPTQLARPVVTRPCPDPPLPEPPPPWPPTPPAEHDPTIHLTATFQGVDKGGYPIDRTENETMIPDMPASNYYHGHTYDSWLFTCHLDNPVGNLYHWHTAWWLNENRYATATGHAIIPNSPPVDTGVLAAEYTYPSGQTATIRFFTVPP